jgi:arabinose-5-phosphate isomerase|tara:strand:+ start:2121 stop:3176 length:1056 start_codon:yes stop_codon:yes gene_type:complete
MNVELASKTSAISPFEQIRLAREVISTEGNSLLSLAQRIDSEFCRAIELILSCDGCVIVSGMGKAGLVGQKIAATLASTGTRSHFLHPGEAVHGDLGRVHSSDVVLILSQSGETEEVVRLLPFWKQARIPLVAVTGRPESTLAGQVDVVLDLGPLEEAGALGLAPSTSTTAMLALGDALALVISQILEFRADDFARFHPGGNLGKKLAKVEDIMRPLKDCRVAHEAQTVRQILIAAEQPGRRSGAILLMDDSGCLSGIFTDSDLARLMEGQRDQALDRPIRHVMTSNPTTISLASRVTEAVELIARQKISELPVVNVRQHPVGLIDITDVVGILPRDPTLPSETLRLPGNH